MLRFLYFFWLSLCLAGCRTSDPLTDLPYAIYCPESKLVYGQDTLVGQVPDIWIFQEPQLLGVFQTPVKVPILDFSNKQLYIAGGIWENMSPATHKMYPFWRANYFPLPDSIQALDTFRVVPVFHYFADTLFQFPFSENFEDIQTRFTQFRNRRDSIDLVKTTQTAFQGISAGWAKFDSTHRILELVSIDEFTVPPRFGEIWTEVAFKGNIKFGISLQGKISNIVNIGPLILPEFAKLDNQTWQLLFFNLTPLVRYFGTDNKFKLYLTAESDGADRDLFLDNIRILYLK